MFNESSILFEDLYHPELVEFYQIFWEISLTYTTAFFIFMLYVIIKKSSKEMGGYKWYLVHQVFWIFVLDLHLSTWKPVTLWPFFLAYSVGIWRSVSGDFSYFPIVLLSFIISGMGFSIYISFLHRYIQISPLSFFYKLYSKLWLRFLIYVPVFITVQSVIALPMYLMKVPADLLREVVLAAAPQLRFFFDTEPSVIGYDRSINDNMTNFTFVLIGVLGAIMVSIIMLILNYIRMMKNNRKLLTEETTKLQRMLFRALLIQVFLIVLFLIFPIGLALTFSVLGCRWTSEFILYAIMLMSFHAIVEFSCMIYFIRPYRLFIKKLTHEVVKKMHLRNFKLLSNTTVDPTKTPSVSVY